MAKSDTEKDPYGPQEVSAFLEEVKRTIRKASANYYGWDLVWRPENKQCLGDLGFTLNDVREVMLGLTVADYCEGPLQDRDVPGDLWVFGTVAGNREIYIKLKLATFGSLKKLRVVSFHPARETLCYPYKKQKTD